MTSWWKSTALALLAALPAEAETRRLAIVVGNNAGAEQRLPLRYAESDAGKVARVLVEVGEVSPDDVLLLQGRAVKDLEAAILDAKERIAVSRRAPDLRNVLIFYFSGHSDGESIELGRERLAYPRLRALLQGTGAEVRLTVVDACRSGSAILTKGGRPAAPFVIKLSDALVASGEVFISSSAADESALESAEVAGSYFTHNLVSGLRGAADASGDKQVTLGEAYRYAYDRTVAATASAPTGGQHPVYDYRLSGQGELVLASLVKASATLLVPDGAERTTVTDLARDQVVVELPAGGGRELALAPGQYGVRVIRGGQTLGGRVSLAEGRRTSIRWEELSAISSGVVVAQKGGELAALAPAPAAPARQSLWTVSGGVSRGVATSVGAHGLVRVGFEPSRGSGFSLAVLGSYGAGGGAAGEVSEARGELRGGYRLALERGSLGLTAGLELGVAVMGQSAPGAPQAVASTAGVAPRASGRFWLSHSVALLAEVEAPVYLMRLDDRLQLGWLPSASLGVAVGL